MRFIGRASWVLLALLVPSGVSVFAADGDRAIADLARAAGQRGAQMRIGLEPAHAVELSSDESFRIVDPETGQAVWKPKFDETLRVVADGGPRGDIRSIYRVQVGAYGNEATAEQERERLERELGVPAVLRHEADRGMWRVRLGQESDRVALTPLMERLRKDGIDDLWIAEEPASEVSDVRLRLVDVSYESEATGLTRLVAVPSKGGMIEVEGTAYRGVVELRIDAFGRVRPINWIQMEHYLLGVVPRELGPEVWPQLEALKAQAVAARTYAWRNRGQFAEDGYDLCATPRCQVYGGASAEHPLSDRAVSATRDEILTWEGRPIVAYYTATCGGHTEDGQNIFTEESARPYLKGVPCRAENDALATLRATLKGRTIVPIADDTGVDVTRDWALLTVAGVLGPTEGTKGTLDQPIRPETLRSWTTSLSGLAGLPKPEGEPGPVDTLGQAAAAVVADLGWEERSRVLLSAADIPALLRDEEASELPELQRRALAYLAWSETIRPFPDGAYHVSRAPSAASLLPALAQIAETYKVFGLREGTVSGVGENSVRLVRGKGEVRLNLAPQPYFFARKGGRPVPAKELEIWPGDRLRYRTDKQGRIDLLELAPPVKGASDDRSAAVYSWEERKTHRELQAAINRRVSVGRLQDLQVLKRGVSGRVIELRVEGSRSSTTVQGFDVRRLLGLRESLMVIEVQRDTAGKIEAVVFAGKGWGHGVGLCQVGAYGMAVRGASYEEILGHYYSGAALEKIPKTRR
jgi:stage II sporulation protein D